MAVASLVVAILAIVVALASVGYTRRQAHAAEEGTRIEEDRRHEELTPELELTCSSSDEDGRQAELTIEMTGPAGLDGLDEVSVKIRDDIPDRSSRPGSQLSQEQIASVIWGPYRIKNGLRDTDEIGRTHGPVRLRKNEPYPIPLERSYAPSWTDPAYWQEQYSQTPIRLEFTCMRGGHKPWTVLKEVKVNYPPSAFAL